MEVLLKDEDECGMRSAESGESGGGGAEEMQNADFGLRNGGPRNANCGLESGGHDPGATDHDSRTTSHQKAQWPNKAISSQCNGGHDVSSCFAQYGVVVGSWGVQVLGSSGV